MRTWPVQGPESGIDRTVLAALETDADSQERSYTLNMLTLGMADGPALIEAANWHAGVRHSSPSYYRD